MQSTDDMLEHCISSMDICTVISNNELDLIIDKFTSLSTIDCQDTEIGDEVLDISLEECKIMEHEKEDAKENKIKEIKKRVVMDNVCEEENICEEYVTENQINMIGADDKKGKKEEPTDLENHENYQNNTNLEEIVHVSSKPDETISKSTVSHDTNNDKRKSVDNMEIHSVLINGKIEVTLVNGGTEEITNEDIEEPLVNSDTDKTSDEMMSIEYINSNEGGSNKMDIGAGDASDRPDTYLVEKQLDEKPSADIIKIKKCRVKLPMKGEKFRVKVVDNFNVPHKLFLKNTDKVEKRKLNMLLAMKLLEPLTCMPMSRLEKRTFVLVKFRNPAKLIRAQVRWIENGQKIEVQDIDNGSLYRVTSQDIFVLDDEQIAHIYPRLFVCTLSEFDGRDIYWNSIIRDLYMSTLRSSQVAIEVKAFHQALQMYEVNIKLLLDEKKFINLNEWLANSLIPYLVFLKTCPASQQKFAKQPPEDIFFPYVKLLKE